MGFSLSTRFRKSGSYLTQFIALGLAVLTIATGSSGWPNSGLWAWASWGVAAFAVVYLLLALWEFFRPPNENRLTFRFPRTSGTLHDIGWINRVLAWVRLDRQRRTQRVQARIGRYMSTLLSDCSTARILTRDLSWADSAKPELTRLAEARALTIVCCDTRPPAPIPSSVAVYQNQGASVKTTPAKSSIRMTMVENSGSRAVAIGYREGRTHIISHIRDQHDPVFQLATTLLDSL